MLIKHIAIPVFDKDQKQLILMGGCGLGFGLLMFISPWLGLAAVVGGIFVVLVLSKPVYLCYLVILATVFTSGMSRGGIIPYLRINEVVLVLVAALAFPVIIIIRRRHTVNSGFIIVGLFILFSGTSVLPFLFYLVRGISLSVSEIFSLIAPLQYLLIYWVFRYLPKDEGEMRKILRLMLICASIVGIVGLLQTLQVGFVLNLLSTWYQSSHAEVALQAGRVTSVLGAWNSLGTFLMLNLIVLRAVSVVKPALLSRTTFMLITLSCAGCLIASGSYASMIGLVVGLLIFEFFDSRGRMAMVFFFLSIAILAIPLRDNILTRFTFQSRHGGLLPATLVFRFKVWEDVFWPIIQKTWLWGFRPVIPSTLAWQYTESQYLTLLLRSGIFSLLAHLLWVSLTLVWLYRSIHMGDDLRRSLSISAFIVLIVLSIMGITNAVFTYSSVSEYVWILIGLIGAMEAKT